MIVLGAGYYSISGKPFVVGEGLFVSFSDRPYVQYEDEEAFFVAFPNYGKEEEALG